MRSICVSLLLLVMLCGLSATASAQAAPTTVIITPTGRLAWTPSADNDVVFGTPPQQNVTSYRADIYLKTDVLITGTTQAPVFTPIAGRNPAVMVDQGKPSVDATQTQTGPATIYSSVQPNIEYVAFVRAVWPGGVSPLSNGAGPFGYPSVPRPPANIRFTASP